MSNFDNFSRSTIFDSELTLKNEVFKTNQTSEKTPEQYWEECKRIIKDNVSSQVFSTWFEPLKAVSCENGKLTLRSPSQFYCEWIDEHFYQLMRRTIKEVIGENAKLQYKVVVETKEKERPATIKVAGLRRPPLKVAQAALPFEEKPNIPESFPSGLNSRYVFENFVVGESNQFATSAAKAICDSPGQTRYNPLVVYGGAGLGKTHLIQALGNCVKKKFRNAKVLYTTSERFTMEYVSAIQNNKIGEFARFYRGVDLLIVDDIQFFAGKEKTQDNFFHTFNALHQAGKQIVLTSDKPPKELKDVDERLISRFQWGLTADIQPPDLEMRMAILKKKSEDEGIDLPLEILEFIARRVKTHIRELEGALISLIAKVTLDNKELNLDLAKEVVYGIANVDPKPLTPDDIKEAVSKYFKIPIEKIVSKSRKHEIALARQMAIYLTKQFTQLSLKSIGSHFGNRDHSTVLHSCQMIENYLSMDKTVKTAYDDLVKKLRR